MENEEWRVILEFPDYMVSSMGRIKSIGRIIERKSGSKLNIPEKILKNLPRNGYCKVDLYKDKKPYSLSVHRLVAQAFVENIEKHNYVNHKNAIRSDNRVSNLEWVSPQGNSDHAKINNLIKKGINHPRASTSIQEADRIRHLYHNEDLSILDACKEFKLPRATISRIINHQSWTSTPELARYGRSSRRNKTRKHI